jgi:F-type H+-transporting ATPase subunit epsilon
MTVINFKIVSPDGIAYQDKIKQVTLPTATGEITVHPNHTPLVTLLRHGEMTIKKEEEGGTVYDVHFAVARGVVEVREGSEVVILADSADRAEDIDIVKSEEARARAAEALEKEIDISDLEFSRFQTIMDRELNRLKIGGKYLQK